MRSAKSRWHTLAFGLLLVTSVAANALQLERVARIEGIPWGMAFLDETTLLVTARQGHLYRADLSRGTVQPLRGLPALRVRGQGGLLDVAVLPDSPWLYFTYSANTADGEGVTTLARAQLDGVALTQWQVLLRTVSATDTDRHYGSRIAFDGDGHVFFSLGDRGVRDNGQDLRTHAGSILRLNLDGSVPADNPFVGKTVNGVKPLPEIWSYGHRNPQGLFYDKAAEQLWAIEHGPRGGDEINLIEPGNNYGWAVVSHGKEYWGPVAVGEATSKPGMVDPRKVYIPSIAPSGLVRYRGAVFPEWQGNLFSGAMKLQHLNRITLDEHGVAVAEDRLLTDLQQRIRNVIEGPKGFLYVATDSGEIYRLRPSEAR